jgi:hypothetical protein
MPMHREATRQRALAAAAFHGRNRDDLTHHPPAFRFLRVTRITSPSI